MNLGDEDVLITIARSAERDDDEGEDGVEEVAVEGATDETSAEGEGVSE